MVKTGQMKLNQKCYKELPRKPRPLAAGMNWQNNCKNHLINSDQKGK